MAILFNMSMSYGEDSSPFITHTIRTDEINKRLLSGSVSTRYLLELIFLIHCMDLSENLTYLPVILLVRTRCAKRLHKCEILFRLTQVKLM